jgi:hypothetical protein
MKIRNVKQATVKFFQQHPRQSPILRRVCHKRHVPVRATEFIEVTDLVPSQWHTWFFTQLSESGKITWGEANRTMIPAEYLADIVEEMGFNETTDGAMREWLKKVRNLGQIYVDLEN